MNRSTPSDSTAVGNVIGRFMRLRIQASRARCDILYYDLANLSGMYASYLRRPSFYIHLIAGTHDKRGHILCLHVLK